MANDNSKRFITMKKYKGIRKDTLTNKFIATKSIKGKRYYDSSDTIKEAVSWKNSFHPDIEIKVDNSQVSYESSIELNGRRTDKSLSDVWKLFFSQHITSKELSTQETYEYLFKVFSSEENTLINLFTPIYVNVMLERIKSNLIDEGSKRNNFKAPLKMLTTMFRWYRENYDHTFLCPILKRHFVMGKIKEVQKKNKKMADEDIIKFFNHLPNFYRDFALVHFYTAGRVQEVAGIQVSSVDLKEKSLLIKDVIVWSRYNKKFVELKSNTKNGDIRFAHLNETLVEVFKRKLNEVHTGCDYVFHKDGGPLSYRQVQAAYNRALINAGLGEFSSTHIMRHSMATLTRKVTGSLEATQAVTGHKDQKLVQHYATLPETAQKNAVISVEKHIINLQREALRANNCEQGL